MGLARASARIPRVLLKLSICPTAHLVQLPPDGISTASFRAVRW